MTTDARLVIAVHGASAANSIARYNMLTVALVPSSLPCLLPFFGAGATGVRSHRMSSCVTEESRGP